MGALPLHRSFRRPTSVVERALLHGMSPRFFGTMAAALITYGAAFGATAESSH